MAMKTYKIPILYQSVMTFNVEAENLQDAVNKAVQEFMAIPDENYLDDSIEIDNIVEDDYPDETFDLDKAF